MPIWRSPSLEAILGAPLDEVGLKEDVVKRLVEVGAQENEQLDFKLNPQISESASGSEDTTKGWSSEQEFAKDICAFANHAGGVIFIGVRDEADVAVEARPTVVDPAALEQRMRLALANFSAPPPRFKLVAIEAELGDHYLALVVPPSSSAPHAVRGPTGNARRPLHYPVRDGAHTRWLLEHEVADRFRSRFSGRAELDTLRIAAVSAGLEALSRAQEQLWLYVAIVPESPAPQTLDRSSIAAMTEWWHEYGLISPLGRTLSKGGTPTPAPGRITISGAGAIEGQEETDPRYSYMEIYADGRAFAATPTSVNTTGKDSSIIGERTLADDTVLLVDAGVSWAGHQAGSWGSADVTIGLAHQGRSTGEFADPVALHGHQSEGLRRIPGTRVVRGPIQARTTADLQDSYNLLGRMNVVRDALTVLLHNFGVAETRQFEPDGTVVTWAWGGDDKVRAIEKWAKEYDLPVQNRHHSSWS